jgi:hypothetical protein
MKADVMAVMKVDYLVVGLELLKVEKKDESLVAQTVALRENWMVDPMAD